MEYKDYYNHAFNGREDDSKRLWGLFYLFMTINSAFIISYNNINVFGMKILFIILGIITTIIWYKTSIRMTEWIFWWEKKLIELEKKINTDFYLFNKRKLEKSKGFSTRVISQIFPCILCMFWVINFIYQIYIHFVN